MVHKLTLTVESLLGNVLDVLLVGVVKDILGGFDEAAVLSFSNDAGARSVEVDRLSTGVLSVAVLQSSKDGVHNLEAGESDYVSLVEPSDGRRKAREAYLSASAVLSTKSALLASALMRSRSLNEPRTMRASPKALETATSSFSERTRAEIYVKVDRESVVSEPCAAGPTECPHLNVREGGVNPVQRTAPDVTCGSQHQSGCCSHVEVIEVAEMSVGQQELRLACLEFDVDPAER